MRPKADAVNALNWPDYEGSMPLPSIVRPRGDSKARLAARLHEAFETAKHRQTV